MQKPGLTLGYRTVTLAQACILGGPGVIARGHEFHYSALVAKEPLPYACGLSDARGVSAGQDGLMMGNVLALYTHLHFASQPQIAKALVDSACLTAGSLLANHEGLP
jgi:cobyrinic acid a,c-diamide synthase